LTLHKQVYPDSVNLNATVDAALARFNEDESTRMVSLKRMRSEPDEDGFITVTRRERDDVVVEKKNHAVDLEDFYKFQKREKRAKKMDELRRKFEEDKFKVARAKEGRKFKPF
jgi:ribosomal RNA-processing protein 7